MTRVTNGSLAYAATQVCFAQTVFQVYCLSYASYTGKICSNVMSDLHSIRYCHRFRKVLQQRTRFFGRSGWTRGGKWSYGLVESVRNFCFKSILNDKRSRADNIDRQIFPSYSSARRPITKNSALANMREKRAALKALAQNRNQASWQLELTSYIRT